MIYTKKKIVSEFSENYCDRILVNCGPIPESRSLNSYHRKIEINPTKMKNPQG